ncbi:MAG: hypothetical protein KBB11_05540 [Bacteroidales bacterium]|nr:hypothetical protein [Bacteroidales bacterium]
MENKRYDGNQSSGKNEKESMDKTSKTLLILFICIFIAAVIIVQFFV